MQADLEVVCEKCLLEGAEGKPVDAQFAPFQGFPTFVDAKIEPSRTWRVYRRFYAEIGGETDLLTAR